MADPRVIVIGAGMGGLAAAADLARRGARVTVLERAAAPGGKMRRVEVDGAGIDGGPTVFTMKWIFDGLFGDAGQRIEDHLDLHKAEILARHAWRRGGRLDLFADIARSAEAIGDFAGARDAAGYRAFCTRAAGIYRTLVGPFIASERPSQFDLVRRVGLGNIDSLVRTTPFATLWNALGEHFTDPRLRQLFARYATYVGCSPFLAPATLMLIAHVEQEGVWLVNGGMRRVAEAVRGLAEDQGATFRFGAEVRRILLQRGRAAGVELADGERIDADAVVFNGAPDALAAGLLGDALRPATPPVPREARTLSAVTWCLHAPTDGFALDHHNVFFAEDYQAEFETVFRRRAIAAAPTAYVCAQDRGGASRPAPGARERLLLLVNAPPDGDRAPMDEAATESVAARAFALLRDCGLTIRREDGAAVTTTPAGFHALFPATGGALYGRLGHGFNGSFARPGARSAIPGLYLAGGGVHPGPGIPMATMSGRLAAARLLEDRAGRRRGVIAMKVGR
jgi:1-hydroxycarotenoid 3,4-desaturase